MRAESALSQDIFLIKAMTDSQCSMHAYVRRERYHHSTFVGPHCVIQCLGTQVGTHWIVILCCTVFGLVCRRRETRHTPLRMLQQLCFHDILPIAEDLLYNFGHLFACDDFDQLVRAYVLTYVRM